MSDQKQDDQPKSDKLKKALDQFAEADLSEAKQKKMGQPVQDPEAVTEDEKKYYETVVELITSGEVDVLVPESLINKKAYDKLDDLAKGKVDLTLLNLCSFLRQIKQLLDEGQAQTFQISTLVRSVWRTKEAVEQVYGDVYKV